MTKNKKLLQYLSKRNDIVIVSRHESTINYLKEHLKSVPVISQVENDKEITEKIVIGNLPANLQTKTKMFVAIIFDNFPPRGEELSPKELEKYGVTLFPIFSLTPRSAEYAFGGNWAPNLCFLAGEVKEILS